MKKISLMLIMAFFMGAVQTLKAQVTDTTKRVEVKNKTKTRRKGRNATSKTIIKGTGGVTAAGTNHGAVVGTTTPANSTTPAVNTTTNVNTSSAPSTSSTTTTTSTPVTATHTQTSMSTSKTTSSHVVKTTHPVVLHKKVYHKKPVAATTSKTSTTVTKTTDNQ